jgi:hypothetical protein
LIKYRNHITALLLIALLALPVMLPFFTVIREGIVRWEMMEALEEKELITVFVGEKDVVWEEAGKECRIRGRLFDVKEYQKIYGRYRLMGLYDNREKEIEEQLSIMTEKQNKHQEKLIGKLFKLSYVQGDKIALSIRPILLPKPKRFLISENTYRSPYLTFFSPPPEVI